jgi:hypothetical protein
MNKLYERAAANPRAAVLSSMVLFLFFLGACIASYFEWQRYSDTEAQFQKATVLTQQQDQDVDTLQNLLNENKQNIQMLAEFIMKAQAGKVQPMTDFIVQAANPAQLAQQVASRINANDPTLPPSALEKTDKTIVTTLQTVPEQKAAIDKQNVKGGIMVNDTYLTQIYKVNNYLNWEWSTGYGWHNGDAYIPIGLQRNYSKDKAVEVEIHLEPGKPKNITGWEVKHVIKTDKLFGLF